MKKVYALLTALLLTIAAAAQTLNVQVGSVTYQFPASQCGEMTYSDGATLTIMGKAFALSDISSMTVDDTKVTDNLVSIVYSGSSAAVTVAGNVAQYVEPTISGAYVSIAQSNTAAVDKDEITYQLSGSSTDGQFALSGNYKCTVALAGIDLTCKTGAAIDIANGKRIQLSAKKDTENSLADCANGSQKACVYSKGQLQLQGNGTLNVVGNTKHAIKSGDYITVKNLTLNITSAVGDGINCEEYLQVKSGTVTISGVGDDGIQCDLGGDTSTGETTDHEDEDSGNIYLEGGTISINCTAKDVKGVKGAGDVNISDGIINITTSGREAEGMQSKGALNISGGHVTVNAYDDAINSAQDLTISGGYVYARATNNDGIDANGNCYIKGGVVYAIGASSPEVAIDANSEEQKKLYVSGGTIVAIGGLESGASLTQACYSTSSWSKNTWYALYNGSELALAFKAPSSGGSTLVVSTSGTTTLKSGVTVSDGTVYFGGMGNIGGSVSGGSDVTLSSYTGGGGGPGGGGGGPGGGGGHGR